MSVVRTDEMMPVEAAAVDDWSECAFSLTCEEDCADLGDSVVDDGEFFPLYNAGDEEEEEYLEQLVFKETSFCSSSSDSAADCDGDGDGDDGDEKYPSLASEEWFRQARLAAVKWILEVSPD
jgi:cyclin D5